MKSMGLETVPGEYNITVPEANSNPNKIGNITRPDPIKCLPGCYVQENDNKMSYAHYPQKKFSFTRRLFVVLLHIFCL